jgi:hypothetical protein
MLEASVRERTTDLSREFRPRVENTKNIVAHG